MTNKKSKFKNYKDQFAPANKYPLSNSICMRIDKIKSGFEVLIVRPCETNGFYYAKGLSVGRGISLRESELLCIGFQWKRKATKK